MRVGVGALKGDVVEDVAADFPQLRLWSMQVAVPGWKSPKELLTRLADIDVRVRGVATGSHRMHGVTCEYRGFARQLGLDPDIERNPLEHAALERLTHGRFRTVGHLHDALLVGMLETGIPLWAFDAHAVQGWLTVDVAADNRVVIRDDRGPIANILTPPPAEAAVGKKCRQAVVYALGVGKVPSPNVEEALWYVRGALEGAPAPW